MKVKTLKAHYYGAEYKPVDSVYFADKDSGERHVRWGLCKEVKPKARPIKKVTKRRKK